MKKMYSIRRIKSYFLNTAGRPNFLGKLVQAVVILALAKIAIKLFRGFIDTTVENKKKKMSGLSARRFDTIARLVKKTGKILVYFYAVLMILEIFRIDTRSLLATAGVGGVAIGFGAQSLVKDVISGFFILQENSYVVGDHVKLQGFEGIVEELGLRTTKIRDFNGDLHTLPNGHIVEITNMSRGAQRSLVIMSIAYEENIDQAVGVLNNMCRDVKEKYKNIIKEGPSVNGVENLGDSSVDIRITAMVRSGDQWAVERDLRKMGKEYLEEAKIEIPYPKIVIDGGDEK